MKSIAERFWPKVSKGKSCWLWSGSNMPKGYGRLRVFKNGKWTHDYAHRVSWELAHGPIPDGMEVLHKCDTPACIRPSHLFLGTQIDNIADAVKKKRNRYKASPGTLNGNAKLTEEDVHEIRARRAVGEMGKYIAADFGISKIMVYYIANFKAWKCLELRKTG